MVSITGLLVADGLGTVLPVVLLLVLVGLCRGWVWAADLRHPAAHRAPPASASPITPGELHPAQ